MLRVDRISLSEGEERVSQSHDTDGQQVCFVVTIFAIWLQCLWGNNYVTAEDVIDWTQADFAQAIAGAKWGVVMETNKITCVWGCKACLLILYAHMT